jgi:hypothetical protein
MLKIVVMKLIELMIEAAPARCSEKIAKSTAGPTEPDVEAAHRRSSRCPRRCRSHREEARHHQADEARDGQPEGDVVHARERHVRRADHQGHEPVGEPAHGRRHDHEEHHDQAMRGDQHVPGVQRLVQVEVAAVHPGGYVAEDLQARLGSSHRIKPEIAPR